MVTVYGAFLPRHIFYRFHALCAYLRCIFVALCVLFMWPSFDVVLADQVSVVIPILKLKRSIKVLILLSYKLLPGCPGITAVSCTTLFLPGRVLLSFSRSSAGSTLYCSQEDL